MPLFRDLGFRDVKFTHGPDEYGKDIVFSEIDQFGVRGNYAALVKVTNILGQAEQSINEIFRQIEDALLVPVTDILEKLERPINAIYVITSKQFTRNAKEKILRKMEAQNIYFNVYFFD